MKKRITILAMMTSIFGFSQETEFKFTKDGFTDYLVIPCEGKTQTDLYKRAIDWVNVTFNNPIMNEIGWVKFEGLEKTSFYFKETGEPKKIVKKIVEDVPQYFNNLNKSFNDFIVNGTATKKKNDW